ncbi:bifunctional DNA-formamidopyrimidine glycosylase/DNA-(apurinic or apyrimidinic site) lyase [Entomobacter blattae]|uniref:Formamidopyrimidine-DNA glycosylase n=1 Tax=Entomobacter blattae TaxID=2762277 RepID=A0A7H1NT40_9PROT|nr:bifunctional DNA-formamidopyrimidine glycosylase/DNA-(apurinic or apyrimidinic site) lyase [Entomobacter blattae]QNT78950.1 Formamidopyrimidine-DNA glycosylase [Entomobacter blattae]
MPELPEVETIMRGMAQSLSGHCIQSVTVRRADLRKPFPANLKECLEGSSILGFTRRAKYICMNLSHSWTLLLHLGMSGRVLLKSRPLDIITPHEHLSFETKEGIHFSLIDPRRFGIVDLAKTGLEGDHPLLRHLGKEPFDPTFTVEYFHQKLSRHKAAIKSVLLDQRVVAGLGNIYVNEALFVAKISPFKAASSLKSYEVKKLKAALQAVLAQAIEAGGSSLRDYVKADGSMGYFQKEWKVYGCKDALCKHCGTVIESRFLAGRSTFYCRNCQKV